MITKNREAVRAGWGPETKALYEVYRAARDSFWSAEEQLRAAQAAMRKAKKENARADAAFKVAPGGAEFWEAVGLDIEEDRLASSRAPSVPSVA